MEQLEAAVARHPGRWTQLREALDLDQPELQEVREAVVAGKDAAALGALLRHYRQRPPPHPAWLPPFTSHAVALDQAEGILEDRFHLQGTAGRQPRRAEGGLDWKHTGPAGDPEWAWILNRHTWFEPLLLAYQKTSDTRYITALSEHLADWVRTNPYPARLTFSAAWRPLEVARRVLNSWTHVFFAIQDEAAFTVEARLLLLSSLPDHADALANHYSFWGGNHLLTETTALATLATAWPEFHNADRWRESAVDRFQAELLAQTYPDGAFKELTNHYQRVVWLGAERFRAILDASEDGIDPLLDDRITAMRRYFEGVMRPDGRGPLNNASDREQNAWFLDQSGWPRLRPVTPTDDGGASPTLYFPWAGHAVMRDNWEHGREWAFFDIGPYGSAHHHRDTLHLSVWFDGLTFLADSGRYLYQPGPWNDYFKGPFAHNVVLLDGVAPLAGPRTVARPLANTAEIQAGHARFTGQAAYPSDAIRGVSPAIHRRTVLHLPGDGWLIADEILSTGSRRLEAIWNFGPEVDDGRADRHLRLLMARDARGELQPAQRDIRAQSHPVRGWYSEQFGEVQPALQRHFHAPIRGRTLLLWAVTRAPTATIELQEQASDVWSLRWEADGKARTVELQFSRTAPRVVVTDPDT